MADVSRIGGLPGAADTPAARQRALTDLAREFEAMLLQEVVKQMREPSFGAEEETLFDTGALLDTLDAELSRQLARQRGLGLADSLATARSPEPRAADPAPRAPGTESRVPSPEPRVPTTEKLHRPDFRISSQYGWRRDPFSSEPRFHAGIDMAAPTGQPVPVAGAGKVVYAGAQGGYGLTVVVEHGPGIRTRYAHLSELAVKAEDVVGPAQVIGRVGATGRSTAPHLHFEVLREGKPVDPAVASRAYASIQETQGDADYRSGRVPAPVVGGLDNED